MIGLAGVFQPGSLYLAQTLDREHQLRLQAAKALYVTGT